MANEEIYCNNFFAELYDWQHPWPDDYDFYLSLAESSDRILDIGCGTGIFSLKLAEHGHEVVGVDPAKAMIEIARNKPFCDKVKWVHADVRNLRLDEPFDMVLMTGNAFQALLTRQDRKQAFATFSLHLKPGGKFFFDCRNPLGKAWESWKRELTQTKQDHHEYGTVTRWVDASFNKKTGIVDYCWTYELQNGERHSATSSIAFTSQEEIAELIEDAGLQVDQWLGNCLGDDFTSKSPEIIPLGSKPF